MNAPNELSQAEQDKALFDGIASYYQSKDTRQSSRPARQHRFEQTIYRLQLQFNEYELLEVGCGAGFSVEYLSGRYASYVGVDHSRDLIRLAQKRFPGVEFLCRDAIDLGISDAYDGVFMIGVLHHMESPQEQLRALHGYLKGGGWIAMNEPNSANLLIQFMRWVRERSDKGFSKDQRAYSRKELEAELKMAGFEDIDIRAQGILSTPFAEVPLRPDKFWGAIARISIGIDRFLESRAPYLLRCISWNLVATARKK